MLCPRAQALCALVVCAFGNTSAQRSPSAADSGIADTPHLLNSPREDWARIADVIAPGQFSLIRSASATFQSQQRSQPGSVARVLLPYIETTWNSSLPSSANDGAQWAGRGATVLVGGGMTGHVRRLHFLISPEIWHTQNKPFPVLPAGGIARSAFASPWFYGPISADLPLRFGYASTTSVTVGQSSLWSTFGAVAVGASAENEWWGPGIRNALIMSNNAEGFPHAFVRTTRPLRKWGGTWDANWIVGALSESRFFDDNRADNVRSLSGAVVVFSPDVEPALSVGAARVVYARLGELRDLPWHALDVVTETGQRTSTSSVSRSSRQLTSLFARWRMPGSAAEVYGEWARALLPTSLRSLLVAPQLTQGFTLGAQWLPPIGAFRLRLQVEVTNLEQSPPSRTADTVSFYTSSTIGQGYTQRGQVIGAAIGPGSSSQWFAADLLRPNLRSLGAFAGRVRWNTDAYYRQPTSVVTYAYDVSVYGGVRANAHVTNRDWALELVSEYRYNFLFQNSAYGFSSSSAFDRRNHTIRLRMY